MAIPFRSCSFALLCLGLATEIAFFAVRRVRPESRAASALRFVVWFMRPVMAAAAVNVWFRMAGSTLSDRRAYPFYAMVWTSVGTSLAGHFRSVLSSEGIWPWLPIAGLLAVLIAVAAAAVRRTLPPKPGSRRTAAALVLLFAVAFAFFVSLASVPDGFFTGDGQRSSLLAPWHDSGSTMLYAVPFMKPTPKAYLRNFHDIQARLNHVIHAKSHPPVASLFVRWIGTAMGVDVRDPQSYRLARARLRYALGQSAVSAANVFLVFLLGAAVFDRRTGLFAALLWIVTPSVSHYATFAPDMNYALFFHGALLFTWITGTAASRRQALACSVPLGLCLAMLVFMNFSWCVPATVFPLFVFAVNLRERRGWKDLLWRGAPPLAVMASAAGWAIRHYHIDYLAIYLNSSRFVGRFYHHRSPGEALMALVGCQVEWLVLLGPLVCTGFFLFLREARREREWPVQRLFAAVLFGTFALPFLFGPSGLKHETARCWIWVASVPVVFAANRWLRKGTAAQCAVVAFASGGVSVAMRLFLQFAV